MGVTRPKEVLVRHLATLGFAAIAVVLCLGAPTAAEAATHVVKVSDAGFNPAKLVIARNDLVRWEWESGNHTLRSGQGPDDPKAGQYWDVPLNGSTQVFELRFDVTGTYEYYSAPYFDRGVKGVVEVKESTETNPQTWGKLKFLFKNTGPTTRF